MNVRKALVYTASALVFLFLCSQCTQIPGMIANLTTEADPQVVVVTVIPPEAGVDPFSAEFGDQGLARLFEQLLFARSEAPMDDAAEGAAGTDTVCQARISASLSALAAGRTFQIEVETRSDRCVSPVILLSLRYENGEEVVLDEFSKGAVLINFTIPEALSPQVLTFVASVRPGSGSYLGTVEVPVEVVEGRRLGGKISSEWKNLGQLAATVPVPALPTTPPDTASSPGCRSQKGIVVGLNTYVDDTEAAAARIRESASTAARILGTAPIRTPVEILAGPVCADGHVWWQVRSNGYTGYTAEVNLPVQTTQS